MFYFSVSISIVFCSSLTHNAHQRNAESQSVNWLRSLCTTLLVFIRLKLIRHISGSFHQIIGQHSRDVFIKFCACVTGSDNFFFRPSSMTGVICGKLLCIVSGRLSMIDEI